MIYTRAIARSYFLGAEVEMPEEPPLVRQWMLLRTLLARHYGATIRRVGFPLEETPGEFGKKRWRIDPSKSQPGLTFAFDEAVALYLGRRLLEPLAGTLFWRAAQTIPPRRVSKVPQPPSARHEYPHAGPDRIFPDVAHLWHVAAGRPAWLGRVSARLEAARSDPLP